VDSIDLLAVLRASQALSSQTSLDRLHTTAIHHLTTLTGATDVLVAIRDDETDEWVVPSRSGEASIPLDEAVARAMLPVSAFRYVERTREPLVVDDATSDDRFADDPYLGGLTRCSLLVVPIVHASTTRAMLLLTNRRTAGAFAADRLDAVLLIAGQLTVSLSNAQLYASLEARVADRTKALENANEQLEALSGTDALTGLANRRRFDQTLDDAWEVSLRNGRPLAVVLIDIDHFKRYNDNYGHVAGDDCLRKVAAALGGVARTTDLVCRYGGEEFVVIVPGADSAVAHAIGERCRIAVAQLELEHSTTDRGIVTLSIGTASRRPGPDVTATELVEAADQALYRAKDGGRDQVHAAPDHLGPGEAFTI
jgi:diguanylate cyclase (GGDEF)-like protein